MGIYVFNKELLKEVLLSNEYADFGKEIFPATIETRHVQMHLFDGYWEDIGTIKSFYDSNLALAKDNPEFRLTTPKAPIYTRARFLPPTQMSGAHVKGSLVANGCVIGEGAIIENSVIGLRTIIDANVTIKDSIIMGCDYYEREPGEIPMHIGEGSHIEGSIIDKNCRIGKNVTIINEAGREQTDLEHPVCVIRDGIPVVIKKSVLPDGWSLESEIP